MKITIQVPGSIIESTKSLLPQEVTDQQLEKVVRAFFLESIGGEGNVINHQMNVDMFINSNTESGELDEILREKKSDTRTRRTKAQIAQSEYNKEVDSYNWFIYNTIDKRVTSGWEFKSDAKDLIENSESQDYEKIFHKSTLRRLGIDIDSVLNQLKS